MGIAPDVLDGRKTDRVDSLLDGRMTCGWELCDPMSKGTDEIINLVGRQRAIDPAVSFGQICVIILGAQHNFERTPTTHKPCQVLRAARARNDSERRLELTKDRR